MLEVPSGFCSVFADERFEVENCGMAGTWPVAHRRMRVLLVEKCFDDLETIAVKVTVANLVLHMLSLERCKFNDRTSMEHLVDADLRPSCQ